MNLGVKHACPYNNNGARAHATTLKEEGAWARVGRVDGGGGDRWRRIWISEWMDGWMDVGWMRLLLRNMHEPITDCRDPNRRHSKGDERGYNRQQFAPVP